MDILQILKKDHAQVREMLEQLAETTDRAEKSRENIFSEVFQALTIHSDFEEEYFYPLLKSDPETKNLVLESYEEHRLVRLLLDELQNLDVTDETWLPKLTVLKENVLHHAKEEENEVFPQAKSLLDSEELKSLAEKYLAIKEKSS